MQFSRIFVSVVAFSTSMTMAAATLGCGGAHVALRSPGPNASVEQRRAAYTYLRPVAISMTRVSHYQNGRYQGTSIVTNHLQLRGGLLVSHPEDLLTVVRRGSPTARFATTYLHGSRASRALWTTALLAWTAGLALIVGGVAADDLEGGVDGPFRRRLIAGGAIAGFGGVLMIPAYVFRTRANRDRDAAFVAYEHDLPESLGFCVDDRDEPVDCGASSPAGSSSTYGSSFR